MVLLAAPEYRRYNGHVITCAGVAELVDAPDSKSGSLRGVGVRFPSPAPL